ncbi:hypothetical protein HCH_05612 [Hahella chejuensis KCTC 2396]|uniref:Uncharacterized protein n=1 Tax=Hahella chejuensis (strain KCTC 2396) TaxID=349521 RepID=Q2SAQ4_HAHCH|nr:hypothetical protein HCH_05612 [Hahella chejuensis KCTC 2396]
MRAKSSFTTLMNQASVSVLTYLMAGALWEADANEILSTQ